MWRVRRWEESQLLPFSETGAFPEEEQVPREGGNVVSVVDVELGNSTNIQVRKSPRHTRGRGWRQEDDLGKSAAFVPSLKLWLAL